MIRTSLSLTLCLPLVLTAVLQADQSLTEQEAKDGWVSLFDGKSLDNFRGYKKEAVPDGWKIVDGAMTRVGGGGDVITKEQYANFELSVEYKISEGGNSGIMFRVVEGDGASYHSGPEIQVQDNVKGHDPQKSGWLYQMYPSEVDTTKPAGQWNELRILISDDKCEHIMNGTKYCTYVIGSDDWNQKLANSKFKKWPMFGKAPEGHICFQDHGNEVAYRNIKIRVLD